MPLPLLPFCCFSALFMAFHLFLQFPCFSRYSQSLPPYGNPKMDLNSSYYSKLNERRQESCPLSRHGALGFLFTSCTSARRVSSNVLSSNSSFHSDETNSGSGALLCGGESYGLEFNRVNCLVWVLHESARSFSLAVESLQLPGSGPELAMAWKGKDVHEWHRRIAYQVAVYALLKTAIEVEILLSQERHNNPCPVKDILTPKISFVGDYIESQLKKEHPELVEWFRVVELPQITGFFIPLLKKWSIEYAGSGVAGIIVAISCCVAVGKLGSRRTSCALFTLSMDDVLLELMNLSYTLVSVDKLHKLSTEAGFECHFLSHFGTKIMPSDQSEELEFWIGLAQKKLSRAFQKEALLLCKHAVHRKPLRRNSFLVAKNKKFAEQVHADSLATIGLFAYLGRKTRLFLSRLGINDLCEHVMDFLSYLECGILFIYPQFSSLAIYQCFMEVVIDEIGWLEFYGELNFIFNQEKRRTKHHTIQAKKEIILATVFTVCYDVFSGFAHFSRSTQQTLDSDLLKFLLQRCCNLFSQSLLSVCLEDYWAAYDRSSELLRVAETGAFKRTISTGAKGMAQLPIVIDSELEASDLMSQEYQHDKSSHGSKLKEVCKSAIEDVTTFSDDSYSPKSTHLHEGLIRKYSVKLMSKTFDVWMGTQLLFIDIVVSVELLLKHLRGHKVTVREAKKIKRTLSDIATLIPITILMLLPVSAVGHAAILAAIRKYAPFLIPSPYSCERLELVKQLRRTKKMDVNLWSNLEESSSSRSQVH